MAARRVWMARPSLSVLTSGGSRGCEARGPSQSISLPLANEVCEGYVSHSVHRGGRAWQRVVRGRDVHGQGEGMRGRLHEWQGGHAWQGACIGRQGVLGGGDMLGRGACIGRGVHGRGHEMDGWIEIFNPQNFCVSGQKGTCFGILKGTVKGRLQESNSYSTRGLHFKSQLLFKGS